MASKNREILFLIENSVKENGKEIQENSLAENIARNLMNKFSISEQDQHEISGLHSYFIKPSSKSIKSAVKQRKIYRELIRQREKIIQQIPNSSGTLDIFICGVNFIRDFHVRRISKLEVSWVELLIKS